MNKIDKLKLAQFGNLELLAKQVVEGFITGMHKSPFHGFSVEFAEHRLYNKGESTKHIDWKLFARSEKMMVKRYEEETNLRCQIVIDTSSSMFFPKGEVNKIEFSIYAAACLIELMKKQRDAVGLSLFSDQLTLHSECKSSERHHQFLYNELENWLKNYDEESKNGTESVDALHEVAELSHRRSLIIIFTDFLDNPEKMDELFEALNHMKHNKHEVVIFHVLDRQKEEFFELENKPYTLVDMETGEKMKLQPNELKEKYREAASAHFHEIKMRCTNSKIDFMTADISEGYQQILTQYLIRRSKIV
ncbi:MAG: DUF58 domain-containing protein [Bacteroidetes bacterium]|nr:DUF58 domain-containing protein [Bacteroidota bacterium]